MGKKQLRGWLWCLPVLAIAWIGQPAQSAQVSPVVQECTATNPADVIVTPKTRTCLEREQVPWPVRQVDRSFSTIRAWAVSLLGSSMMAPIGASTAVLTIENDPTPVPDGIKAQPLMLWETFWTN